MLLLRSGLGEGGFQGSLAHRHALAASFSKPNCWRKLQCTRPGIAPTYLWTLAWFGRLPSVSGHTGALQACSARQLPASVSAWPCQRPDQERLYVQESSRAGAETQPTRPQKKYTPSTLPRQGSTKCPAHTLLLIPGNNPFTAAPGQNAFKRARSPKM